MATYTANAYNNGLTLSPEKLLILSGYTDRYYNDPNDVLLSYESFVFDGAGTGLPNDYRLETHRFYLGPFRGFYTDSVRGYSLGGTEYASITGFGAPIAGQPPLFGADPTLVFASGDTFIGGTGVDLLRGYGGDDNVQGNGAGDSLYGDAGADYLYGGSDNDYLNGGAGRSDGVGDALYGGEGNDVLQDTSSDFADYFDGGTGDDQLYGGGAGDIMYAGDGADYLFGAGGNDHLTADAGNDYASGDEGNDNIAGGAGYDYLYGGAGDDYLIGGNGSNGSGDSLFGGNGNDTLQDFSNDFADYFDGGAGSDSLYGSAVGDVMHGGTEADYLGGGFGGDEMHGDAGNDVLDGGPGGNADFLDGGVGSDALIFGLGFGRDIVANFDDTGADQDLVYFDDSLIADFAAVQARMTQITVGPGDYTTFITLDPGNVVELRHTNIGQFGADDFVFF